MGKKFFFIFLCSIITCSSITGCWDKVEIDQRAFVGVILVDLASPEYVEKTMESIEEIPPEARDKQKGKMLKVTYIFPDARLLGAEGGGGDDKPGFIAISSAATSIAKTNGYVDSRLSRQLYFAHTQIVVLGEDFLKDPDKVKEVLDYLDRSARLNRTLRIFVSEGEASGVSEVKPKDEKIMFRYIRSIQQNEVTNGRMIDVRFYEFVSRMRTGGNGILPRLVAKGDEIKISGIGLIKDFKLVGFLSEYDSLYFNTLNGERRGGRVYLNVGDVATTFATNSTIRKIRLTNSDPENLEVTIHVNVEGNLMDSQFTSELFDAMTIADLEKEYNKMEEENCKFVIKRLQKEFKVDALSIGEYLEKFHPSVWDKVKDKWADIYPQMKITPVMDYKIRRIGTAK